jgi:hypothetical protein
MLMQFRNAMVASEGVANWINQASVCDESEINLMVIAYSMIKQLFEIGLLEYGV